MSGNNMAIWDANCVTDPSRTKPVNLGRRFTAIDSYGLFEAATRQFGPVGKGWGWTEHAAPYWTPQGYVVVSLRLWWRDEEGEVNSLGPIYASNRWVGDKGKVDEECLKKATTDAITKSLSMLGFSADVFLGKFDDNKYVEQAARTTADRLRVEAEAAVTSLPDDHKEKAQGMLQRANSADHYRTLLAWCRERAA